MIYRSVLVVLLFTSCSLFENENSSLSGKLVYTSKDSKGISQVHIYSEKPIPKHTQITFFENNSAFEPSFNPDGTQIVFTRYNHRSSGLYIMKSDGTEIRPLFYQNNAENFAFLGAFPKWSPKGDKILFSGCTHCDFKIKYFDINNDTLVTVIDQFQGDASYPSWSPDGQSIVFVSDIEYRNQDSARYRSDLYTINIDGSDLNRLTNTGEATFPTWSPSGDKIAYEWNIRENNVYLLDLVDLSTRKIETSLTSSGSPRWNKDGDKLMIAGSSSGKGPKFIYIDLLNNFEILYTVNIQGTNLDYVLDWILD